MSRREGDAAMWASFHDVIELVTRPVVDETAKKVDELCDAVEPIAQRISGVSIGQDDTATKLRRLAGDQEESEQRLRGSIDAVRTELLGVIAEGHRQLHAHLMQTTEEMHTRLDQIRSDLAARAGHPPPVHYRPVEYQPQPEEPPERGRSVITTLTWALATISLIIVVVFAMVSLLA